MQTFCIFLGTFCNKSLEMSHALSIAVQSLGFTIGNCYFLDWRENTLLLYCLNTIGSTIIPFILTTILTFTTADSTIVSTVFTTIISTFVSTIVSTIVSTFVSTIAQLSSLPLSLWRTKFKSFSKVCPASVALHFCMPLQSDCRLSAKLIRQTELLNSCFAFVRQAPPSRLKLLLGGSLCWAPLLDSY